MKTRLLISGIAIMVISVTILLLAVTSDDVQKTESSEEKSLSNLYKDKPEVVAFYDKYNDANVSVREDHVSYFAGNGDDFRVRMNLYFDENYDLTHMRFYCYVGGQLQHEVPQEDIVSHLQKYHCQTDPLNKMTLFEDPLFTDPDKFVEISEKKDSKCFTTPSMNYFCYAKPRMYEEGIGV